MSGTCKAFQEDMDKYLSVFLEPWFKAPNQGSYQIAFKARNSSHNKRDDIIKALAGGLHGHSTGKHISRYSVFRDQRISPNQITFY